VTTTRGGLWSKVLDADRNVDGKAWDEARETGQHVGRCGQPGCGQPLKAGGSYQIGGVTWYEAECTSPSCDNQPAAHGPRPEKPEPDPARTPRQRRAARS
jgi:hypothetical protein